LNNLGNIYSKLNQPEIAKGYYRSSLPISFATNLKSAFTESLQGMAALFKASGNKDSTEYYARYALKVASESKFMGEVVQVSRFLADFYKERGNADSAFAYLNMTLAVKDTLFSEEKLRQAQILAFQENVRQQQLEAEKKKTEEQRKTNIQYAFVGVGVVTFL